jgi:hypothetical protein
MFGKRQGSSRSFQTNSALQGQNRSIIRERWQKGAQYAGWRGTGSIAPTQKPVVDGKQRNMRKSLLVLKNVHIPTIVRVFNGWMASQQNGCGQFMRTPNEDFINKVKRFLDSVKGVYENSRFSSTRITVFDYDEFTHFVTQQVLKTLSLIHSATTFYSNDKGLGSELSQLIKQIHSLYVLSTCDDYFGREIRDYTAAVSLNDMERSKQIANAIRSSPKLRSIRSSYINGGIATIFAK